MIMCSYKKIAITNREIFQKYHPGANSEEYAGYIRRLAEKLDYIILREKDLTEAEYEKFARLVLDGCKETQEKLILHTYIGVARRLGHLRIHLPMPEFVRWQKDLDVLRKREFPHILWMTHYMHRSMEQIILRRVISLQQTVKED